MFTDSTSFEMSDFKFLEPGDCVVCFICTLNLPSSASFLSLVSDGNLVMLRVDWNVCWYGSWGVDLRMVSLMSL